MAYLGKTPSQGVRSRYYFTATGGETSFSGADDNSNTLTFTDGNYVDVYLNGVLLVAGTDYNTTTANTVAGLTALVASDVVEIVVYDTFSVFSGNVSGNFSVGGNLSVTGNTTFSGYTESTVSIGTVTSSHTLDITSGTFQTVTLTASTAATFTMPTASSGKSFVLIVNQAATTGNGTATFTGVLWAGGTAPTVTAAAGSVDMFSFVSDGTNWYGNATQDFQ